MVLHVGFSSDVTMVTSIIQRAKAKCAKGWAKGTVTLETSIKMVVTALMTGDSATCEVTLGASNKNVLESHKEKTKKGAATKF